MDIEDDVRFPCEVEDEDNIDDEYSYITETYETEDEKEKRKLSNYFHKFSEKDNKVSVTIRLDRDIVDWFKSQNGKYQTLINAALRAVMQIEKDKSEELF